MSAKILSRESVKESVDSVLSRIFEKENSGKFRCHEIARLIKQGLADEGYQNPVVKNGRATYDANYLEETAFEWIKDAYPDLDINDLRVKYARGSKVKVWHSWCEVGEFVVDHHNLLRPNADVAYQMLTIIDEKQNLAGKVRYDDCGKSFSLFNREFLYIPFCHVTRIRC